MTFGDQQLTCAYTVSVLSRSVHASFVYQGQDIEVTLSIEDVCIGKKCKQKEGLKRWFSG